MLSDYGNLNPSEGIAVFTDGSCWTKDKIGGWAWVAIDAFDGVDFEAGYSRETTISQMELYAATRALDTLGEDYGEVDILLYSDSEYVVLGFNNKARKRTKNLEFWKALEQYAYCYDLQSVTMEHVKGHDGNEINELADRLAGQARKEGQEQYGIQEGCSTEASEIA